MSRLPLLAALFSACLSVCMMFAGAAENESVSKQSVSPETKAAVAKILALVDPTETDVLIATMQISTGSKSGLSEPWLKAVDFLLTSKTAKSNPKIKRMLEGARVIVLSRIDEQTLSLLRQRGDYREAYLRSNAILKADGADPEFEMNYYIQALLAQINDAQRAEMWDEAIGDYRKVIELTGRLDPKDPEIAVLWLKLTRVNKLSRLSPSQRAAYWKAVDDEAGYHSKLSPAQKRGIYRRAEKTYGELLGIDSLPRLNSRFQLAYLDAHEGANKEALRSYAEVIAGKERLLGESHIDVVDAVQPYVAILSRLDRHDEAIAMLKSRIRDFDLTKGRFNDRIQLINLLSKFYAVTGQYDLAIALNRETVAQWPGDHPISIENSKTLYLETARLLEKTNDPISAIKWYLAFAGGVTKRSEEFDNALRKDAADAYLRAGELSEEHGAAEDLAKALEALLPLMNQFANDGEWEGYRVRFKALPGSATIVAEPEIKSAKETRLSEVSDEQLERVAEGNSKQKYGSYDSCLDRAQKGDPVAMINLATMYIDGTMVAKNESEAFRWLKEASGQGHAPAMSVLGGFYRRGFIVDENLETAATWLERAVAEEDAMGKAELAELLLDKNYDSRDENRAFTLYRDLAANGSETSLRKLAWMYYDGIGTPKNPQQARALITQAASLDSPEPETLYSMGRVLRNGIGGDVDQAQAIVWYRKASDAGHRLAKISLGTLLLARKGGSSNPQSLALFKEAYEAGVPCGAHMIGKMYQLGLAGVESNKQEAADWYRKAIEGGCQHARKDLEAIQK